MLFAGPLALFPKRLAVGLPITEKYNTGQNRGEEKWKRR
jgi:hypothetical protein